MIRVLVNAGPMSGLLTGINRYLRQLYRTLEALGTAEIFYMTKNGPATTMPKAAESRQWSRQTSRLRRLPDPLILAGRSLDWLRHEHRSRRELRHGDYDLYHETALTPANIKHLRPQIFTLHDLSLLHWRETHPRERVWFAEIFMRHRLQEADQIITPSEFIRQELQQTLAIPAHKISVTYEAAADCFQIIEKKVCRSRLKRLNLPQAFALFVGSLEPRKNIDTLVQALALSQTDIPLVLSGSSGWGEKRWQSTIKRLGLKKRIITTGYVSDIELVALYNQATVMIYPSLYEGFGLPVIEAMACGAPVITANRASLPEVAGNAAILLDNPRDAEELAQALDQVVLNSEYQKELQQAGLLQAATFSWKKTAAATERIFQQLLQ